MVSPPCEAPKGEIKRGLVSDEHHKAVMSDEYGFSPFPCEAPKGEIKRGSLDNQYCAEC
jgi:hypothetical protein